MNDTATPVEQPDLTAPSLVAVLNKSEIDQQVATAHQFPRSIQKFHDESMAMVTLTEAIAGDCIYSLPRDGKVIEGPSVRFAEIVFSAWNNCRAGSRVIEEGAEFVTAQGAFYDLERNVAITAEIKRRITDRAGRRYKPDMIAMTANAACSVALRNAIIKGIPKAFWNDVYEKARQIVKGDVKTLVNRRADAMKVFQGYGIKPERIFESLGVAGVDDITTDHLVILHGVRTAIKEGETTPENAFATPSDQVGEVSKETIAELREKLGKKSTPKKE